MLTVHVAVLVGGIILSPVAIFFLAKYSMLRFWVFVGGAMLVFQSADGLSAAKLAYFAVTVLCAAVSFWRVRTLRKREWWTAFKPAIAGAVILFVVIGITAVMSIVGGEDVTRVARDALTYLLICIAPLIGLDAASSATYKGVRRSVLILCGLASVSFAVFWLSRRGVSTFGIDRLVLASMMLVAIGVASGVVRGLTPKINVGWLAFGIFALSSVLITGTRTGLILIVALVAAVGTQRKFRIPLPRFLGGLAVVSLSVVLVLPILSNQVASVFFFQSRLGALLNTLENGFLGDASGVIRARAYDYAAQVWSTAPMVGVGLGHSFPNPNPMQPNADFQLDTPVLYLAKFGVLGTVAIFVVLVLFAVPAWRLHLRTGERLVGQTVAKVFVFTWALILPFGTPTEDKGFALALAMMFLILGVEAKEILKMRGSHEGTERDDTSVAVGISRRTSPHSDRS